MRYAKSKTEKDRIWFYTVGPKGQKAILYDNFAHQVIDVDALQDEQLGWDMEQIRRAVQ